MSTTTTNYNMVKPALTDAPDITTMNANWDTVDAKMALDEIVRSTYPNTSANDTYAITVPYITTQSQLLGIPLKFLTTVANTTGCTLNVNGYGDYAINKDVSTALETGDILANSIVMVVWDGARYQILELNGVVTKNGTQTLANKTLTTPKFGSAGYIADANGNELIKFSATVASAVNEVTVSNTTTGNAPSISASGGDTNIGLDIKSKGTGIIRTYVNSVISAVFDAVASAVNYLTFKSSVAGSAPTISATGTDTNIDVNILPKGTGRVKQNGTNMVLAGEDYRPNLLINGDFQVWQRGASFNTLASQSRYTADRWKVGTVYDSDNVVKNNDALAFSTVGNERYWIAQPLELTPQLINTLSGKTVTLSFDIKADVGGFNAVATYNDGVDTATEETHGQTYTVGTSYTRIVKTFQLPTLASNLAITPFRIYDALKAQLPPTSIYLRNVKLELNDHATPFIPRRYGEELALCQRYFEQCRSLVRGVNAFDTWIRITSSVSYKADKRVAPTIKLYSGIDLTGTVNKISREQDGLLVDYIIYSNRLDGFGSIDLLTSPSGAGNVYAFTWIADAEI